MTESTTIRVSKETYTTIKELAAAENGKIQDVVEQAVKEYKKKRFFDELNTAWSKLKKQPDQWISEKHERDEWESTLKDGIEE